MNPLIPVLTTERLILRPFEMTDLDAVYRILDVENQELPRPRAERAQFLAWTVQNYHTLARLNLPPYGERAVVERQSGAVIGSVGLVPAYGPFGLLPGFSDEVPPECRNYFWPEFGLSFTISAAHRRKGYACEACRALADYLFRDLKPCRIVAITTRDNKAAQGVMTRLGMRLEFNPEPEPAWFQVIGVLENPTR